ncbi:PREDICTED: uncharacterized protein LOC109149932 isoform X3 [Ipomoea nil]|uniref:uncharacterized protein LOC109149932 isoform X3 n=1 Tax=Ipomoea nil TaxID=35883 RepID=UPI0009017F0F|nr:PREDICTED: uncharacterized protein LOC109149932 isoform X3 [Ipomoea nil]
MSLKLHHQSFVSSRCYARKTVRVRVSLLQKEYIDLSHILPDFRNHCINLRKSRKIKHLLPFASAEDGVTVNQSSKSCTSTEIEEMRMKLDLSLQSEDNSSGLLQSIHDAARLFELGIKQQGSLSRMPWFSTAWLGVDNTAWVKVLSYQASVYSLLQAANDVSSRGDGRDKDINVFIQQREFLVHFGPRAAVCNVRNDQEGNDEAAFWVGLIQKQLRQAIDRERIWSRLTTSESIEVLERDLAIFGFFIALGKTTQSFLSANGYDLLDEPIEGLIRYLIGGSILYYPQLSSISSYQLYVEVVCEELDWLPFYPGFSSNTKCKLEHRSKELPNSEAVLLVLDVCCYWTQSFIRYSRWLENPVNVKAARYVSTMHVKIKKCMTDLGIEKNHSGAYSRTENEPNSFDKAMESVEEALIRLEGLLKQLHMSRNSSGEHFKAACSDLEKIRRLKKEAEFLEASFSAMAASLEKGDTAARSSSLIKEQHQYSRGEDDINANNRDMSNRGHGLWSFLVRSQNKASDSSSPAPTENDGGRFKEAMADAGTIDSKTNEVQRFKILRSELMELERRVKRSADWNESEEEEIQMAAESVQLVPHQKKENIIGKSLEKLKETSTDVLQGTQLLAIDVAAAMELLRRAIIGDELTEKEKQALRRTLTDLASVIPIGFLMLLPVTAVGHAAMLAAIQRYVPALIPSTYGPERLALLRQLEKVKEMETEVNPNEKADE